MSDVLTKENYQKLEEFINKIPDKKGALIEVLHQAQHIFGYLPEEVQYFVSEKLQVPASKVFGVVSFYSYFTTKPRGKYKIDVCLGTVCFVKGADKIIAEFEKELSIKSGETTEDKMFSLQGLRCVGACGLAPVVLINEKVFGAVKLEDVKGIVEDYRAK
ncbi:NAD(P)H-dependent oxidoreductase subunit E [Peptostreptococcaceae bacterium AGR-M142]